MTNQRGTICDTLFEVSHHSAAADRVHCRLCLHKYISIRLHRLKRHVDYADLTGIKDIQDTNFDMSYLRIDAISNTKQGSWIVEQDIVDYLS